EAAEGLASLAGGGRRRRGWATHRGASASRGSPVGRPAGAASGNVRRSDAAGARPRRRRGSFRVNGRLVLEDRACSAGEAIGRPGTSFGELVFNTAMSGYQEVLTDPSYAGQIVVMTAAHIGNYGVRGAEAESERVHVAGFIARDFPRRWSGAGGEESLAD